MNNRLRLAILAQTIEDILRYDLDRPLTGAEMDEADSIYEEAIELLSRHPTLWKKFLYSPASKKKAWLYRLEKALND